MPLKIYQDCPIERLMRFLKADKIQILIVPEGETFYTISMDYDDFFVSERFDWESELDMGEADIIEKWGGKSEYHTLTASTGTEAEYLSELFSMEYLQKYSKKN